MTFKMMGKFSDQPSRHEVTLEARPLGKAEDPTIHHSINGLKWLVFRTDTFILTHDTHHGRAMETEMAGTGG